MIISILNTKGGVAKTTTAMLLGLALKKYGAVRVVDADPQGSASRWAMDAESAGTPLGFSVSIANQATLTKEAEAPEKFILIDTPPGDSPLINASVKVADLALIPTGTSALDMQRMWETHDAVKGIPKIILITQVEQRTKLYREAVAAIDSEDDVVRADVVIPKRQVFKRAMGTCPDDLAEYAELADELIKLAGIEVAR